MRHPFHALILGLTFTAACGDSNDTGGSTETVGPTSGSEPLCSDDPFQCCCFEVTEGTVKNRCLLGAVCSTVPAECSDEALMSCTPDPSAEEAVDCILEALLADTPGTNRWVVQYASGNTVLEETVVLHTAGDGTIAWLGGRYELDSEDILGVHRYTTASLGLDACRGLPAVADRFACLREAFSGEPVETCIEPF